MVLDGSKETARAIRVGCGARFLDRDGGGRPAIGLFCTSKRTRPASADRRLAGAPRSMAALAFPNSEEDRQQRHHLTVVVRLSMPHLLDVPRLTIDQDLASRSFSMPGRGAWPRHPDQAGRPDRQQQRIRHHRRRPRSAGRSLTGRSAGRSSASAPAAYLGSEPALDRGEHLRAPTCLEARTRPRSAVHAPAGISIRSPSRAASCDRCRSSRSAVPRLCRQSAHHPARTRSIRHRP